MPNTYHVVNLGALGNTPPLYSFRLRSMQINKNDTIIVCFARRFREYVKALSGDIPSHNLADIFQRPHDRGEVLIDNSHFNHIGNTMIGEYIGETVFIMPIKIAHMQKLLKNDAATESLNVMANNADFQVYLESLRAKLPPPPRQEKTIGSIVMNCNPFTLGHQYLIEYAAGQVDFLYVFVVEEDRSFFPFAARFEMAQQGSRHLPNVMVLPSGGFIISQTTFPEYFDKDANPDVTVDPSLDLSLFGQYIAPALRISRRYAGEEPADAITNQYNMHMESILPRYGVEFVVIPRKRVDSHVVSASYVRKLMREKKEGWLAAIEKLVPSHTYEHIVQHTRVQ